MPFVPGFRKPDVRKRFASNAIGLNLGTGVIGSYCEERPIAMRRASHDRERGLPLRHCSNVGGAGLKALIGSCWKGLRLPCT
jgi:hypothetical protein